MRFNTAAYDKAFPRKQNEEKIETVADKFTPTADKLKDEPAADPAVEPTDPDGGGNGD